MHRFNMQEGTPGRVVGCHCGPIQTIPRPLLEPGSPGKIITSVAKRPKKTQGRVAYPHEHSMTNTNMSKIFQSRGVRITAPSSSQLSYHAAREVPKRESKSSETRTTINLAI